MSDKVVSPDTGEVTVLMSKAEALAATAKIASYMGVLCQLVKEAHDKQAWRALGYGSWAAYCKAEFDYSRSYSYRLIGHVNRILELSAAAGIEAEVSPMGDTLTERATRDLPMAETVEAVKEAVADLPDEATDEQKASAATEGIAKMRARKEAEAQQPPEPNPVPCSVTDCPTNAKDLGLCPWHLGKHLADEANQTSDEGSPAPSDEPQQAPTAAAQDPGSAGAVAPDAAATGRTDADITASGAGDDGGQAVPATAPPVVTLPTDWADRVANATYLTRIPAADAAACASPDDIADLSALTDWCFQFVQAIEEQNA